MRHSSSSKSRQQDTLRIMHTFSRMLGEEGIDQDIQDKLVFQLLDSRDIFGANSSTNSRLRSLAFSVYSRCPLYVPSYYILAAYLAFSSFLLHNYVHSI